MQFQLLIGMLLALVVAVFAVQNASPVDIRFLFWRFEEISLVIIILLASILGALVVLVPSMGRQIKMAFRIRELNVRQKELDEEIQRLKESQDVSQLNTSEEFKKTDG